MEPILLLPIVLFAALVLLFLLVVRRAGRFVARTRELEGFRTATRELELRVGRSLDGAAERIDAVRRQQLASAALGETLVAATDAVARYADEAAALRGPREALEIRDGIVRELARAGRALDMVTHGVTILDSVRRGSRELEAQTSIKRGYLNLIHARAAISRYSAQAAELEPEPGLRAPWAQPNAADDEIADQPDRRDEAPDHTI
jgi:hypothetical protein